MKEKQLFGTPKDSSLPPVTFYKIQPTHEFLGRILAKWDSKQDDFKFTAETLRNFAGVVCSDGGLYPKLCNGLDMSVIKEKLKKERTVWDFIQRAKNCGAVIKTDKVKRGKKSSHFSTAVYTIVNTNWVLIKKEKKRNDYDPTVINGIISRGLYSTIMMFSETVTPLAVIKKLPIGCYSEEEMITKFSCLINPKQHGPTYLEPLPREPNQPRVARKYLITNRSYVCDPLTKAEWQIFCEKRNVDKVEWYGDKDDFGIESPILFRKKEPPKLFEPKTIQVPINPTYKQLQEAGAVIPKEALADGFFLNYAKMKKDLFKAEQTIKEQKAEYDHNIGELEAERDLITEEYNKVIDKLQKKDEEIDALRKEKENEIKRILNVFSNTESKLEHDLKRIRERNAYLEEKNREMGNGNGDGNINLADL